MGLRDAFRSRKEPGEAEGLEDAAAGEHAEDPIRFTPRSDGRYRAVDLDADQPESAPARGWLRFAGARAYWAPGATPAADLDAVLGPGPTAWAGEYTTAGRFTVQRRFERPVIHSVLEVGPGDFVARVTAATPGESGLYRYVFLDAVVTDPSPDQG